MDVAILVKRLETGLEPFGAKNKAANIQLPVQKFCASTISLKLSEMNVGQSVSVCENVTLRLVGIYLD